MSKSGFTSFLLFVFVITNVILILSGLTAVAVGVIGLKKDNDTITDIISNVIQNPPLETIIIMGAGMATSSISITGIQSTNNNCMLMMYAVAMLMFGIATGTFAGLGISQVQVRRVFQTLLQGVFKIEKLIKWEALYGWLCSDKSTVFMELPTNELTEIISKCAKPAWSGKFMILFFGYSITEIVVSVISMYLFTRNQMKT